MMYSTVPSIKTSAPDTAADEPAATENSKKRSREEGDNDDTANGQGDAKKLDLKPDTTAGDKPTASVDAPASASKKRAREEDDGGEGDRSEAKRVDTKEADS